MNEIWTYKEDAYNRDSNDEGLIGFSVEATDGSIGKVDEATNDAERNYLVVDTGPWIFGKKVLLPAGVVKTVDLDSETIFIDRTRDQVKNSPEFDETSYRESPFHEQVGSYFGSNDPISRG